MRSFIFFLGFFTLAFPSHAFMTGFSSWSQKILTSCPSGYVLVPRNAEYVGAPFCIMKYEAKAETDAGGSYDADGLSVPLGSYKPASVAANLPWRSITQANAKAECESLGTGYHLTSNAQWQTVARNLELVGTNWTSGTVGSGCMFQGNNGETTCGYNAASDPVATSSNARGQLSLSNGEVIHDFGGNLAEWVIDINDTSYGAQAFFSTITDITHSTFGTLSDNQARRAKAQFGPSGTYGTANNNSGLGEGYLTYSGGAKGIARGGAWLYGGSAGVFAAGVNYAAANTFTSLGFRCVFIGD